MNNQSKIQALRKKWKTEPNNRWIIEIQAKLLTMKRLAPGEQLLYNVNKYIVEGTDEKNDQKKLLQ